MSARLLSFPPPCKSGASSAAADSKCVTHLENDSLSFIQAATARS